MKKAPIFLSLLLAAAAFTACSDDNEITKPNQPTAEEVDQALTAKLQAINKIMRPLAGLDGLPDNWETAIFTPAEGVVVDEATPEVRYVMALDMDGAQQYFKDLVPEDGLEGNTWRNDSVGTLTYTAVGTDKCFATIDVDLKQMPGLKQIRLVPENVIPANSKFSGRPYYNMGDVVVDKDGHYWFCVRPSGGPLKKDQSYFVSFDKDLLKLKTYDQDIYAVEAQKDKNGRTIGVKTKTKTSTSGKWTYATNLVDEKIAIAAAHTFATIANSEVFSETNPNLDLSLLDDMLDDADLSFHLLVNTNWDDAGELHRVVYVAYGSYESGDSKFVQEKKIQPILGLDLQSNEKEVISTYQYFDWKNQKDWGKMSLTSTHSEYVNTVMNGWDGDEVGYPTPFNICNYTIGVTADGFNTSSTKLFGGYEGSKVLVLTQKKITDKGQPCKDFVKEVVKSPFSTYEGNDFYYATLVPRYIYDKSHFPSKPNIVKKPQE